MSLCKILLFSKSCIHFHSLRVRPKIHLPLYQKEQMLPLNCSNLPSENGIVLLFWHLVFIPSYFFHVQYQSFSDGFHITHIMVIGGGNSGVYCNFFSKI